MRRPTADVPFRNRCAKERSTITTPAPSIVGLALASSRVERTARDDTQAIDVEIISVDAERRQATDPLVAAALVDIFLGCLPLRSVL